MVKSAFSLKQKAWLTAVNKFQLLLLHLLSWYLTTMSEARQAHRVDLALHLSVKEVSKQVIRKSNLIHMLYLPIYSSCEAR